MLQLGDLLQVRWDCIHSATREEAESLRAQLEQEGVRVYTLPGRKMRSETRLLQTLKRRMHLPHYFAGNWVSLQYCLRELEETQPTQKGYVLFLDDGDTMWRKRRAMAWKLLRAWRSAAPVWHERGVPFHLVFVSESGEEFFDPADVDEDLGPELPA